jgi:hypothetical protein
MFIKKRSDGEYDLVESITVKGKTKRKIILHLGNNSFFTHALRLQQREARAARRSGETQIDAETRRFRAKELCKRIEIKICDSVSEAQKFGLALTSDTLSKLNVGHQKHSYANYKKLPPTKAGEAEAKRQIAERMAHAEGFRRMLRAGRSVIL